MNDVHAAPPHDNASGIRTVLNKWPYIGYTKAKMKYTILSAPHAVRGLTDGWRCRPVISAAAWRPLMPVGQIKGEKS